MKMAYRHYNMIGPFFSIRRLFPVTVRRLAIRILLRMQSRNIKMGNPSYVLTYFVTNRCMLKCAHCFYIGEINQDRNLLSLDEVAKVCNSLKGRISHLVLTGGEPLLRPDLGEIARIFWETADVKVSTIVTSGYLPDQLQKTFSYLLKNTNMMINCHLSLDGPESIHNSIRGKKDSFSRLMESFEVISKLRERFGKGRIPVIHICTTISSVNKDLLREIVDIGRQLPRISHSFTFMRGSNNTTFDARPDLISDFDPLNNTYLSVDEMKDCFKELERLVWCRKDVGFYERLNRETMRSRIEIHNDQIPAGLCPSGYQSLVLYSDGGLARCEMLREMGNVRETNCDVLDFLDLKRTKDFFKKTESCFCGHECNLIHFIKKNRKNLELLFSD